MWSRCVWQVAESFVCFLSDGEPYNDSLSATHHDLNLKKIRWLLIHKQSSVLPSLGPNLIQSLYFGIIIEIVNSNRK